MKSKSRDLTKEAMETDEPPVRNPIARWLAIASLGFLSYGYVAIALAWICAATTSDFRQQRILQATNEQATDLGITRAI